MPTRRTSPRRTATRPTAPFDHRPGSLDDDDLDEPGGFLVGAAPWLALIAIVLSSATVGYVFLSRGSGGDLASCRTAAWNAVPSKDDLPNGWTLGSTDLSANGMTISIVGPAPADETTQQPVVYASVTCYGDGAAAALDANRKASKAAGATVSLRDGNGDAYDIDNATTGSVTTLFRVGGLVGQVADGGTASTDDLAAITISVAIAMGDGTAAGESGAGPVDQPGASDLPASSDDVGAVGPSDTPFAPELEALLPRSISDPSSTASPPAPIVLTVVSAPATDVFGDDPPSRALAARIRSLGSTFDQLQIARAFDETGTADVLVDAFRLPSADVAKVKAAVMETWLSSTSTGVKTSTVTLGDKELTKIDYGDAQPIQYVYVVDDAVIVIATSSEAIATQVAAQLK